MSHHCKCSFNVLYLKYMKKIFFLSFLIVVAICFSSCASKPNISNFEENVTSESTDKKIKKNKNSLFEDWRYKGFGVELPAWFEPAYLKDSKTVRKVLVDFSEKDVIIGGNAISADHAEQLIAQNKNIEGYEFVDSCWAKLSKEVAGEYSQTPYVFLIVLKKSIE